MPMRFDCVLPTLTVSPIWNSHFHNPGSTWVRLNSTPLRFIWRPSDSSAIRLFSGEEKVCSKQNNLPGCTGKCPDLVSWTRHKGVDAKSPPNEIASSNQPQASLFSGNDPPRCRQRLSYD